MTSLDRAHSWIIVRTATDEPIMETWNASILAKINLSKYHYLPVHDWLAGLSKTKDGLSQKRIAKG